MSRKPCAMTSMKSEKSLDSTLKDMQSQLHDNGDDGPAQKFRPISPVPSDVSLRSDRSAQEPINLRQDDKRPISPVPSDMSLRSDRSAQEPINLKQDDKRSSSPVPSDVSLKSDRSAQQPINLKQDNKRFVSPEPSDVSLRSDRSAQELINLKQDDKRSSSPVPSDVSLRSDRSAQQPINLKQDVKRSCSPVPSDVSLRSDRSAQQPISLKEGASASNKRCDSDSCMTIIETLKQILRERYKWVLEGTSKQGNPSALKKIYTDVCITESLNDTLNCQHDESQIIVSMKTSAWGKPVSCNNIFKPLPGENRNIKTVMMKGVAGIGKTVSVQKFILDWTEEEANQDVHLIFPLPFRELNLLRDEKYTLNGLLCQFFTRGINEVSLQTVNLLFVFDGLDECRLPLDFQNNETLYDPTKVASVDVLVTNLIKGNLLPNACIWITSRPASVHCIPNDCVDRVTEVRGFNELQKEEFFRKRLSDESLANRIIIHLKSLWNLYIMCQIPVFCWIAATVLKRVVLESGWDKIPKSLTQMYTYFLLSQINSKKKKYLETRDADREVVFKLGKLAFEQLEKGNLIFYKEDLNDCGIDAKEASVYSGVCTQIFQEEFGLFQRKVYSFVHLSIQEHLAALYVFLSFYNYNTNVLEPQQGGENQTHVTMASLHRSAIDKANESKTGHLDLLLRFLLGFSLESNQTLIQGLMVQSRRHVIEEFQIQETTDYLKEKIRTICAHKAIVFFHCLNELNDRSLVDQIQSCYRSEPLKTRAFSRELWGALVFKLISSEEQLEVFELGKFGRSDETLLYMYSVFNYCSCARLSNCNITVKSCAFISVLLHLKMAFLKELDLSHNNVQDSGVKMLCAGLEISLDKMLKRSSNTEKLNLLASFLTIKPSSGRGEGLVWDKAAELLFEKLVDCAKYTGMQKFDGLQSCESKVEILRLENCGITSAGCSFLASILSLEPSPLRKLDLSKNEVRDSGVKLLADVLKSTSCFLHTIILDDCKLTMSSCAELTSALHVNSNLKFLSLCNNELWDSGVKLLAEGLRSHRCKLETLRLTDCKLKMEGFSDLAKALRLNPSHLRVLDLSQNKGRDLGLKLLLSILENTQCRLETLRLKECGITENSCGALACVLSSESLHLRELDLSVNDLKDSGAKLLLDGLARSYCRLQTLTLISCNISDQGFSVLDEALQSNPSHVTEPCKIVKELRDSGDSKW